MFEVKVSSFILLTLCVVLSLSSPPEPAIHPLRLPKNTVPRTYTIQLEPDIDGKNFTFNGTSTVNFKVLHSTNDITIHASALIQIDKTYTKITHDNGMIEKPISQDWNPELEFLTLKFKQMLTKGDYQIDFKWKGVGSTNYTSLLTQGFIRRKIDERSYVVATQLKPRGAHSVFPCWDEPVYRADFKISVKYYSNYTAISNMPVAQVTTADNGQIWTSFKTTPSMSPHMVSLVVGAYNHVSGRNGNVELWSLSSKPKEMQFIQDLGPLMIRALEDYTGIAYPLPKLNGIYVPKYIQGANEYFGVNMFSDNILYDPEVDHVRSKYTAKIELVEAIAYQWFGCLVTPEWWDDSWLSGAFPLYFGYKLFENVQYKRGIKADSEYLGTTRLMKLKIPDIVKSTPVISVPKNFEDIDRSTFSAFRFKGVSVLQMLEHILSDDVMQRGLKTYLQKYKYGSATTDDLWTCLQEAMDEKARLSSAPSVNIKAIMDPWLKQTGHPLVNVARDYEAGVLTITQSDAVDPKSANAWSIPITYTTSSQLDISNTTITHWLHPSNKSLQIHGIPKDDWILLNLQLHDFYEVAYDRENWKRIAAYLNTDNYDKIPVLHRVQILNHATNLSHDVESDLELIIDILSYLPRETNPIPLLVAKAFLSELSQKLINTPSNDEFKKFSLSLMENTISRLGFSDRPGDSDMTELLRQEVSQLACQLGHEECKRAAMAKLMEAINSKTPKSINRHVKNSIYCAALSTANETIWELAMKAHDENPEKNLNVYRVLGCTKNQMLIRKYLALALNSTTYEGDTRDDVTSAFYSLGSDPAEQYNFALDLLLENEEKIKQYHKIRNNSNGWSNTLEYMSILPKTSDDQAKLTRLINKQQDDSIAVDISDVKERVENSTRMSEAFGAVLKRKTHIHSQG